MELQLSINTQTPLKDMGLDKVARENGWRRLGGPSCTVTPELLPQPPAIPPTSLKVHFKWP